MLMHVPGTGANALYRAGLDRAADIAMAFGPGTIKAWHASPYDFAKFDLSKVGTGQGAQSFGHGIYTAESPAVSGPGGAYDMEFTAGNLGKADLKQGEASVLRMIRGGASDMDVIGDLARNGYSFDEALGTLNRIKDAKAKIYEVSLNAKPSQFLDWDKPLTQQSPEVQGVLSELGVSPRLSSLDFPAGYTPKTWEPTGEAIYKQLVSRASPTPLSRLNAPPFVSAQLNEAGIPGIRYLDQGSRGAGDGTSNYVMFNDRLIDILRKYGILAPAVGGGLLAGYGEEPR